MRITSIFSLLCAGLIVWSAGCSATQPNPDTPSISPTTMSGSFGDLKGNDPDTVYRRKLLFYAAGMDVGQRIAAGAEKNGLTIEEQSLRHGLSDGLNGRKSAYDPEALAEATTFLESRIAQNIAARRYAADPEFRAMCDQNLARSREAMEEFSYRVGVVKHSNGVLTKQMKPGTGRYLAGAATATGHFSIYYVNGVLVRESEPGKPVTVKTAKILPALLEAIQGMQEGATWRVAIPSELAYGLGGAPPAIGSNQALIYEIELLKAE